MTEQKMYSAETVNNAMFVICLIAYVCGVVTTIAAQFVMDAYDRWKKGA